MPSCARCGTPLLVEERVCPTCGAPAAPQRGAAGSVPTPTPAAPPQPVAPGGPTVFQEARGLLRGRYFRVMGLQALPLLAFSAAWVVALVLVANPLLAELVPLAESIQANPEAADAAGFMAAVGRLVGVLLLVAVGFGVLTALALALGVGSLAGVPAGPRVGAVAGAYVLVAAAVAGVLLAGAALAVLIVPIVAAVAVIVYLTLRWALAYPVILLEGVGARGALARSSQITRGHLGKVFLGFLPVLLLQLIVLFLATFLGTIVGAPYLPAEPGAVPTAAEQVVSGVGALSAALVAFPLLSATMLVLYRRLVAPPVEAMPPPGAFPGMPPRPPPF